MFRRRGLPFFAICDHEQCNRYGNGTVGREREGVNERERERKERERDRE